MNIRAHWQYYKDIFPFIAGFGIICCIATNILWGFGLFCTLGLLFGFFGFRVFKNDEYYFYYNLGITKWNLLKISFFINLLIAIPLFSILLTCFYLSFGDFTST
tara:strand:+ start:124 stop:435 length:312 start_codon:yes stop_codon:yes gene_type:complete